jgi:hypothetical protein
VTISYISAASAAANSVTLGTHAVNDLITLFAFNNTSATVPSLPAGWTSMYTLTATIGWRVGYLVATSAAETSGTWTNADGVIALVHRASSGALVLPGINVTSSGTATNITYGAIGAAIDRTNAADRWMITLGSTRTADSSIETAPTSFTNRISQLGGTWEMAAHDSNGTLGSYGGGTVTAGGTSALFRTLLIQLFETPFTSTGGGGALFLPRCQTGGYAS